MSEHKERPILFTGPMVRAIMEGRKTQTRRVVRPQPPKWAMECEGVWPWAHFRGNDPWHGGPVMWTNKCPYGVPSDRLWVRESWRIASLWYDEPPRIQYRADGAARECDPFGSFGPLWWADDRYERWYERVNGQLLEDCEAAGLEPDEEGAYHWTDETNPNRWRPSIHMPRWASRLTLEITGVRVERLQSITEDDAKAEGCDQPDWPRYITFPDGTNYPVFNAREGFEFTWDRINAKRGYGWNPNPWVWVLEFQH